LCARGESCERSGSDKLPLTHGVDHSTQQQRVHKSKVIFSTVNIAATVRRLQLAQTQTSHIYRQTNESSTSKRALAEKRGSLERDRQNELPAQGEHTCFKHNTPARNTTFRVVENGRKRKANDERYCSKGQLRGTHAGRTAYVSVNPVASCTQHNRQAPSETRSETLH
jgi:hypothetical protein